MARQQLVFKNTSELVHIWANKSTIVEYNCIPKWCGDSVAKLHKDPALVEPIEVWKQYRDIWFSLVASTAEKRFKRTVSQRLALACVFAEKANNMAMLWTFDCHTLSSAYFGLLHPFSDAIAELIEVEDARKERKRIEEFDQCLQQRMDWLSGEKCYYPNRYENDIVLRVAPDNDNLIETSRGALVPLKVCAGLYRAFKTATMPPNREVGIHQLDKVTAEGLTIGCNFIKAKELERFAKVLGVAG